LPSMGTLASDDMIIIISVIDGQKAEFS
jgi:hypothetical protein